MENTLEFKKLTKLSKATNMDEPELMSSDSWMQHANEGVILVRAGRVRAINKAALQLLELSEAQALDMPLIGVLRDHRLEQAYLSQEKLECETRGRYLMAKPFPEGLILQDITELKKIERNSRELLAVLSHELRTPVTVIRSTLEALQGDVPANLRKRFMDRAVNESERLVRLLEDLTVDVKPPQYRHISIQEVAERAINLLQPVFTKYHVELETEIQDLTVWADADKLLQVLINLLENAAIHGPDDALVKLVIKVDELYPGFACIQIQDQGCSLKAAEIEELFEPHSRAATVKTKGTGLGLYIVRNIAKAFGGEAWGKPLMAGNEFGVRIPLNR